ncbi:hypothetical protein Hanom_Chr10g00888531 [Helianthus anomalus]
MMLRMPLLMNHITRHNNRIRIMDTGVKFLTCNQIIRIDMEDTVDTVMSLRTHHCMMIINPLTRAIRFNLIRYHIYICIIIVVNIIIRIIIKILLIFMLILYLYNC